MSRNITEAECTNCRAYLVEKINGLEKWTKLLFGTSMVSIALLVVEVIRSLR